MRKFLILLSILIITQAACEKSTIMVPQSLVGEWLWISTCGGIYYSCSTPQSTGQRVRVKFTPQSLYNYYLNDSLLRSVKYHTYISKSPGGRDAQVVDFVTFDFDPSAFFYSIAGDTLSLWDGNMDGTTSLFKRMP